MHPRAVAGSLGFVLAAAGALMLIPTAYALVSAPEVAASFGLPALGALVGGGVLSLLVRSSGSYVSERDVFLIVVLAWVGVAFLGALPFYLSGLMGPADAYFEAMAGFTTTGATTVAAPQEVAQPLLLWRSLSQWAGGIGIVVLFVAVGPLVGLGASQLLSAEATSPMPERLTPRIRDTAKTLAIVYLSLTAGGVVALFLAGMSLFDAVNHSMTTVATGGFSTRSESIAAFDSLAVELAIVAGMLLSGASFALYFQAARGRRRLVSGNPELRVYLGIVAAATVLVTASLYLSGTQGSLLTALREGLFQSVSLLTGTAFIAADWEAWGPFAVALLTILMLIGGSAGSTSGGIKVIRATLLVRHARQQVFHLLHPRAVTPLKLRQRAVPEQLRVNVLGFFFIYIATLAAGTLLLAIQQVPLAESFGSVYACLSITGIFFGPAGEASFYADLPATARLTLTVFMLLGRLELFTVLVILTPAFWRG